jgi:hypothetical protein
MNRIFFVSSFACALFSLSLAGAQEVPVPNSSFEELTADGLPVGWTLSGGTGGAYDVRVRQGKQCVQVRGTGEKENTSFWRSPNLSLEPGAVYSLRYLMRQEEGQGVGGSAITGMNLCNVDWPDVGEKWQEMRQIIAAPTVPGEAWLRFGQWESKGKYSYDAVRLFRTIPVYRKFDGVELGAGERVMGNAYNFAPPMAEKNTNQFRALRGSNAYFNTNRLNFSSGQFLTFEHAIAQHPITGGRLFLWTKHYGKVTLEVEVGRDGQNWTPLGEVAEGDKALASLPETLFPTDSLWVRIKASQDSGGFAAMHGYRLEATVDGPAMNAVGDTQYVDVEALAPGLSVAVDAPGMFEPGRADGTLSLRVKNETGNRIETELKVSDSKKDIHGARITIAPGDNSYPGIPCPLGEPGKHALNIDGGGAFRLVMECLVPEYFNSSYGELLDDSGVWWASSGWKIPKMRVLPKKKGAAMRVEVARNEAEAAQLVLCPPSDLANLRLSCAGLEGPAGARLAPEAVEILRVRYVPVTMPTDNTGVAAPWPDPLPPIAGPLTLAGGENHPFWVRVKSAKDTPAGEYKGLIRIEADGYQVDVPLQVRVFGFALPDRMTCVSAFGFGLDRAFDYQKITEEPDKRKVTDQYLRALADHHITPYNPAPLDHFEVTWTGIEPKESADPAKVRCAIDWTKWDAAMQRAFDNYHFNSFAVPIQGMGSGTFYSRTDPSLLGFPESSPVYQALFKDYCAQVEEHLRAKGWLDDSYVYWFDEPEPRDYEFVMGGFNRIKNAAPGIGRMLTEQIEQELVGGPNIWCPLTPGYKKEAAHARQAEGDRIWWYVCTGPKAPYATLFIDHAATDLRVWLWQTWQRDIQGILIWETLFWNSPTAYPDPKAPQNPYEDPMGWECGYGNEPGRRPWGNGDGRFLYPPEAAADGNPAAPVFDPPVDTIRIEMLRDGIEDYEYMVILKRLLAEKGAGLDAAKKGEYEGLLTVPSDISESLTEFTKDPAPIEAHRRKVAEAVETLEKR